MKTRLLLFLLLAPALKADTTMDSTAAHAYGANTGWINTRGDVTHGAVIGEFICSGYLYSANCGWISLGTGAPANGIRYQNNTPDDFGVNTQNYSSSGGVVEAKLRGYAYGANIGWVNFEATGDPRVDLATGQLKGHAYSANTGWIALSGAGIIVRTTTISQGTDTDSDGISDAWEYQHTGNLTLLTSTSDHDHDGSLDQDEYAADTDPLNASSSLRITAFVPPRQIVQAGPFLTDLTWTSRSTRWYSIELNAALTNSWTVQVPSIPPGNGATTFRSFEDSSAVRQFYRVRARLPLAP
jgi:hypothetical protein